VQQGADAGLDLDGLIDLHGGKQGRGIDEHLHIVGIDGVVVGGQGGQTAQGGVLGQKSQTFFHQPGHPGQIPGRQSPGQPGLEHFPHHGFGGGIKDLGPFLGGDDFILQDVGQMLFDILLVIGALLGPDEHLGHPGLVQAAPMLRRELLAGGGVEDIVAGLPDIDTEPPQRPGKNHQG